MADMQNLFGWDIGVMVVMGLLFCLHLQPRHYENKGIGEGVRFGFYLGLLLDKRSAIRRLCPPAHPDAPGADVAVRLDH